MKRYHYILYLISIVITYSCQNSTVQTEAQNQVQLVNTSHLDALFEEIEINGEQMGIIHIYSEYPDYQWVGDDDEGIACVDDAARAAIFYLRHYQYNGKSESLDKARKLTNFILYMQSDNGYFNNFIWQDHSINRNFKTSLAEPNWWTWRAIWALAEAFPVFNDTDVQFAEKILKSLSKAIDRIKPSLNTTRMIKEIDGFERPAWLPFETASDQAAVLLMGLVPYYEITKDQVVLNYIHLLAEGITLMQEGDSITAPYGAFLSWENQWHAWGNNQSSALLRSYQFTNDKNSLASALIEIDNFYPYAKTMFLNEFIITQQNGEIVMDQIHQYPQIAYNIRPMVFAVLEAYNITKDSAYAVQAAELATWFIGENIAQQQMYFPQSGLCFDGITNESYINKNSGAESTIEALLTLLEIENNPISYNIILDFISRE